MAKSKSGEVGSPIGYAGVAVGAYERPAVSDNNPDGPSQLPDYNLAGYTYNRGPKKICFPCDLGKTESPNKEGGVNVNTANGVSSSQGQNPGAQYNWGDGNSGVWNKNSPFDGGNMTGM